MALCLRNSRKKAEDHKELINKLIDSNLLNSSETISKETIEALMNPKPKKSEKERFIGDAILLGHHATASLARIASRIPHPIFCCAMGSGLAVLVYYWRSIVGPLLAMTSALLNHQLPSKDALVVFALCVGSIVFVVVQSRDAMDEYYEREIQKMLEGGI